MTLSNDMTVMGIRCRMKKGGNECPAAVLQTDTDAANGSGELSHIRTTLKTGDLRWIDL